MATGLALVAERWTSQAPLTLAIVGRVIAAQGNKDEWTSLFVAVAMCGGSCTLSRVVATRAP